MDRGTGRTAGPKKVIGIHTRDIHIRVPGGFSLPVSNTNDSARLNVFPFQHFDVSYWEFVLGVT